MSIKDELKQYRFKMKRVDEALEEYEKFKTRAEKVTAVFSDVASRTNKTSDKVGENSVKMADIERQYKKRWEDAEQERLKISEKICTIDEPYRTILFMKYVQNKNFELIATEIGYSYKQILRLHGQALQILDNKKYVL